MAKTLCFSLKLRQSHFSFGHKKTKRNDCWAGLRKGICGPSCTLWRSRALWLVLYPTTLWTIRFWLRLLATFYADNGQTIIIPKESIQTAFSCCIVQSAFRKFDPLKMTLNRFACISPLSHACHSVLLSRAEPPGQLSQPDCVVFLRRALALRQKLRKKPYHHP